MSATGALMAGVHAANHAIADKAASLLPAGKTFKLVWHDEADAHDNTNFTEWGVVGKFPYTFGIFLTLAQGLDVRADYARIVERQRM